MGVKIYNQMPLKAVQKIKENTNTDEKTYERLKEENEKLKKEWEDKKLQDSLALAEIYEKQENDKLVVMQAIAEMYEMEVNNG